MKNEEHKLELVKLETGELYELSLLTAMGDKNKDKIKSLYSLNIGDFDFLVSRLLSNGYLIQGNSSDKIILISGKKIDQNEFTQKMLNFRLELIQYLLEKGSSDMFAGIRSMNKVENLVAETMKVSHGAY